MRDEAEQVSTIGLVDTKQQPGAAKRRNWSAALKRRVVAGAGGGAGGGGPRRGQGLRQPGGTGADGAGPGPVRGSRVCFRGRRGDLIKLLWWDGDGLCLFAKRLERGRFVWPRAKEGVVVLSRAQLSMLLEGIDWRMPRRTWRPELAG